ncbi:MAG: hypothetical protein HYR89_04695 [Actinobacteria bacterium]|nr:hypothetical protein [Actinomycetota bacterium]
MAKVAHASASAEETAPDITPLSLPPQRGWARGFGRATSALLVIALFWALFTRMTDFREVIDIGRAEIAWWEGAALVIMATLSLVMSFAAMVAALPGLRWRDAAHVNLTTTAVAYGVPGGGAAGTALTVTMLRSLGFGRDAITLEVLSTGVWNGAVKA